jgi:hypothetical protein
MINKEKLPLYIALAVPALMIALVAAFIYLPGLGQRPRHNFLYMSGSNVFYYDGGYGQGYQVSSGHLVFNPPPYNPVNAYPPGEPHFYIYDVVKNAAAEVSVAQAESYTLDPTNTSPDGYTIQQGNGGGDFLFGGGGGDYSSWFIKGHNRAFKLNLKLNGSYSNFRFLGWME